MYEIKITGEGTIPEIQEALKILVESLANEPIDTSIIFEDEVLLTEIKIKG